MSDRDEKKKKLIKSYDVMSHDYDRVVLEGEYFAERWIRENFPKDMTSGEQFILDLACGSGHLGKFIFEFNSEIVITGLDLSKEMLKEASRKGVYNDLIVHDLDESLIPLQLGEFNLILGVGFLEFIEMPETLLFEVIDLLKPGGQLICSFEYSSSEDIPKTVRPNKMGVPHFCYSKQFVSELFRGLGLNLYSLEVIDGYKSQSLDGFCPYIIVHGYK